MLQRPANPDPRVRKSEKRHDDERREVVQGVLESENRRGHTFARVFEREEGFLLSLARQNKKVPGFGAIEFVQEMRALPLRTPRRLSAYAWES